MKRSPMPERKTPLTSSVPLARSTPLPRSSTPLPRTSRVRTLAEVRASRPTVSREEREARQLVRERSGGVCEGAGRAPATDYAHRVGKAQGGPWCPSNALHLCRDCHSWSHAFPVEARSVGWLLRSTDKPETFPALLHGRGLVLLTPDGEYAPAPTNEGDAA